MNSFDIFVLITTIIIIIVIIMVNINYVIDKRLSNVAVNIPPINIPSPEVTVKIQKSCTSDEYNVFIDNNNKGQYEQQVSLSPVEHFITQEQITNKIHHAKNTVSNISQSLPDLKRFIPKSEVKKYNKPKSEEETRNKFMGIQMEQVENTLSTVSESLPLQVKQLVSSPKSEQEISDELTGTGEINNRRPSNIQFPNSDEIVEYGNYVCSRKPDSKNAVKQENKPCKNQSLIDMKNDAYQYMIKNSAGMNDYRFPDCENTGDNINGSDIEPLEHYRKYQTFVKAYLDDPIMRSYNIGEYQEVSKLFTSGMIPLADGVANPKPMNYIFESSPTFNK